MDIRGGTMHADNVNEGSQSEWMFERIDGSKDWDSGGNHPGTRGMRQNGGIRG